MFSRTRTRRIKSYNGRRRTPLSKTRRKYKTTSPMRSKRRTLLSPNFAEYIDEYFKRSVNLLSVVRPTKTAHMRQASISRKSPNGVKSVNAAIAYVNLNGAKVKMICKYNNSYNGDSLLYEYLVGQHVNRYCDYFPTFVYTYELKSYVPFLYADDYDPDGNFPTFADVVTRDGQLSIDDDTFKSFYMPSEAFANPIARMKIMSLNRNQDYYLLLLQNCDECSTVLDVINKFVSVDEADYELCAILFQVYSALAAVKGEFTHYDLHGNNVLCKPIGSAEYAEIEYTMPDGSLFTVRTRYIAKMIDYGRSHCPISREYAIDALNYAHANTVRSHVSPSIGQKRRDFDDGVDEFGIGKQIHVGAYSKTYTTEYEDSYRRIGHLDMTEKETARFAKNHRIHCQLEPNGTSWFVSPAVLNNTHDLKLAKNCMSAMKRRFGKASNLRSAINSVMYYPVNYGMPSVTLQVIDRIKAAPNDWINKLANEYNFHASLITDIKHDTRKLLSGDKTVCNIEAMRDFLYEYMKTHPRDFGSMRKSVTMKVDLSMKRKMTVD